MTELHIQIKLENEGIPKFGMHISRALLKDLVLQQISFHTNKLRFHSPKSKLSKSKIKDIRMQKKSSIRCISKVDQVI